MSNLPVIRKELEKPEIKIRIEERLKDKAGVFTASLLDLCSDDKNLAECNPLLIVKEAMKAAALDLPINKNLGFAYLVPYNKNRKLPDGSWESEKIPQFQMGWRGYVQLAIRTGKYKHLNGGYVYDGEEMIEDRIRGTFRIEGKRKSDNIIGYFCYMELLSGFKKSVAWEKERVLEHAKAYSKSWDSKKKCFIKGSAWESNFDAMGLKTMILQLVPKWGPMSIDMADAMQGDFQEYKDPVQQEIDENANSEVIDIDSEDVKEEKEAIIKQEMEELKQERKF